MGRAEQAKKNRKRYLAEEKQERGELTEEESTLLGESWKERRKLYKEFVLQANAHMETQQEKQTKAKKEDKKAVGKDAKGQQEEVKEVKA